MCLKFARVSRKINFVRKGCEVLERAHAKTADARGAMRGLRRGECLSRSHLGQNKQTEAGCPSEVVDVDGEPLQLGFRAFGKVLAQRKGIGGTTATVAAASVTVAFAVSCQQSAIEEQLISRPPDKISAVVMRRHYDATPRRANKCPILSGKQFITK